MFYQIFCRRKYQMLTKNQTPWKNFRCTPRLEAVLAPTHFANEGQCAYLSNGGMKWLMFVKCSESIFSCTFIDKADFYPRLKKSTSLHFSVHWVCSQGTNTSLQQHSIFIQKMEWDWIMQSDPRVLGNFSLTNAFFYSKSCLFMIK